MHVAEHFCVFQISETVNLPTPTQGNGWLGIGEQLHSARAGWRLDEVKFAASEPSLMFAAGIVNWNGGRYSMQSPVRSMPDDPCCGQWILWDVHELTTEGRRHSGVMVIPRARETKYRMDPS